MSPNRVVFIDVESPVLNVYDCDFAGIRVGQVLDFGLPDGNRMCGAWRILSLERLWHDAEPAAVRVNIIRKERICA